MPRKFRSDRLKAAIRRWEDWGDWRIIGGWDYVPPMDRDIGFLARREAIDHSDPVLHQMILTERQNGREQTTDLIFDQLPSHMRHLIRRRYHDKQASMALIWDEWLERHKGNFEQWGTLKRGSDNYINLCRKKASIAHKEACEYLLWWLSIVDKLRGLQSPSN